MKVQDSRSDRCHSERSGAESRMERLGKPRHGREGRRLSERQVSESNPVASPSGNSPGSFDFTQDDNSPFWFHRAFAILDSTARPKLGEGGSFVIPHF